MIGVKVSTKKMLNMLGIVVYPLSMTITGKYVTTVITLSFKLQLETYHTLSKLH